MINRAEVARYREFSEAEDSIPIFSKGWWLDAACGPDSWGVAAVTENDDYSGCLPYEYRRRGWYKFVTQPPATPYLGPWIRSFSASESKQQARERQILNDLIDRLPPFDYFAQNWSYEYQDWLPFFWRGFSQTTRYTYVLHDMTDLDSIWTGFHGNIRTDARKATDRFELRVEQGVSIDRVLELAGKTFARQNRSLGYNPDQIARIEKACRAHNCCESFVAMDQSGRAHAAAFVVWDQNSAYYLIGGADPELRKSGASSLCLWSAIQFASKESRVFNFEGSMIRGVERFFRGFGARQTPYFHLRNVRSPALRLAMCILGR